MKQKKSFSFFPIRENKWKMYICWWSGGEIFVLKENSKMHENQFRMRNSRNSFRAVENHFSDMWESIRADVDGVEEMNVFGCVASIARRRIFLSCNNYNGKVLTCIVSLRFKFHINCHPPFRSPSRFPFISLIFLLEHGKLSSRWKLLAVS